MNSSNAGKHARHAAQAPQTAPRYSRAYAQGNAQQYAQIAASQKPFNMGPVRHTGRRILVGVLVVLLAALVAVAVAVFVYLGKLDAALALDPSERDAIQASLTEPVASEPYYVLLIGSDSREGVEGSDAEWAGHNGQASDQRSDVMMLARIDEKNRQVTLLSIPRDTCWQFSDGTWGKLNYTYTAGGVPYTVQAVETLSGVPISHVVEIHMSGLMELVDVVGGITVNVEMPIDYHEALTSEEIHLDAGEQRLTGAEAEVYARERLAYNGVYQYTDQHRQSVVRIIVEAIINEIMQKPVTELPGIILESAECVDTDYTSVELLTLLWHLGRDFTLYQGTAPYQGAVNENTMYNQWLTYQNPEGWNRVMQVVISGGDPSTVSYEGDTVSIAGGDESFTLEDNSATEAENSEQPQ